jgi:hypothetical protein
MAGVCIGRAALLWLDAPNLHFSMWKGFRGGPAAYAPISPGSRAQDFQTTASGACLLVACKGALLFAPMAVVAGPQNHVLKRAEEVDISMS